MRLFTSASSTLSAYAVRTGHCGCALCEGLARCYTIEQNTTRDATSTLLAVAAPAAAAAAVGR